jgi:hypothetical protein
MRSKLLKNSSSKSLIRTGIGVAKCNEIRITAGSCCNDRNRARTHHPLALNSSKQLWIKHEVCIDDAVNNYRARHAIITSNCPRRVQLPPQSNCTPEGCDGDYSAPTPWRSAKTVWKVQDSLQNDWDVVDMSSEAAVQLDGTPSCAEHGSEAIGPQIHHELAPPQNQPSRTVTERMLER